MSNKDHLRQLLTNHIRRLQILKEKQALEGIHVAPNVILEIESIELAIEKLQGEIGARADSTLQADSLAPVSKSSRVCHNLPHPDYGNFVGREEEMARAIRILRPYPHSQHPLVTIDGIGGVGKSALALEIAYRYVHNYDSNLPEERFESIIWTSAKQTVLTAEGIAPRSQVLRTLNDIFTTVSVTLKREDIIRATHSIEQLEIARAALTQQRTLLIIDNLETIDDEAVMDFLRELPAPTKAIVTTRHRIDVAYPVRLVGMPWKDAQTLIFEECSKKDVTLNEHEARRLYDRTGGIPLAIVWSIAQMGFGYSIELTLARLGQPTSNIIKFCFEQVIKHIEGKPPHNVLMTLSLFATDASREAIGNIAGFNEDISSRDEVLVILEKLSLINKTSNRFHMLPLTKSFARNELQKNASFRYLIIERWIEFYINLIEGQRSNIILLEIEYENIKHVMDWLASTTRKSGDLAKLVKSMGTFFFARGYWNDWNHWLEISKKVSIEQSDELSLGEALRGLGQINVYRREARKARENLEEARRIFDRHEQIFNLINVETFLGRAYMFNGEEDEAIIADPDKAAKSLSQALRRCQELSNKRLSGSIAGINVTGLSGALIAIHVYRGQMFTELGDFDEAERSLYEALKIHGEKDESAGLNFIYWCLGALYFEMKDYEKARQYLSQTLNIAMELQIATDKVQARRWLAMLEEKEGNLETARKLAEKAREEASPLGMKYHAKQMGELIERVNGQLELN